MARMLRAGNAGPATTLGCAGSDRRLLTAGPGFLALLLAGACTTALSAARTNQTAPFTQDGPGQWCRGSAAARAQADAKDRRYRPGVRPGWYCLKNVPSAGQRARLPRARAGEQDRLGVQGPVALRPDGHSEPQRAVQLELVGPAGRVRVDR